MTHTIQRRTRQDACESHSFDVTRHDETYHQGNGENGNGRKGHHGRLEFIILVGRQVPKCDKGSHAPNQGYAHKGQHAFAHALGNPFGNDGRRLFNLFVSRQHVPDLA
jgi:hypothetical protein